MHPPDEAAFPSQCAGGHPRAPLQHPYRRDLRARVKRFIVFHGKRHPSQMGEAEVATFLTHLAGRKRRVLHSEPSAQCARVSLQQSPEPPSGRMRRHRPCQAPAAPPDGAHAVRGRAHSRQLEGTGATLCCSRRRKMKAATLRSPLCAERTASRETLPVLAHAHDAEHSEPHGH